MQTSFTHEMPGRARPVRATVAGVPTALLVATLATLLMAACATTPAGPKAMVKLDPTKGNAVSGTVNFVQMGDKVRVFGTITGLKPNAEHGFHVHDKGDCSSGDGMSTGGHFNPAGVPHGHAGHGSHHAGDLPNLKADANGSVSFSLETPALSVGSGAANVVGRGMIVHRDPDDYKSQPAGNAGPRLACGVITAQ